MLPCMGDAFAGFQRSEIAGIPVLWKRDTRFKTFRVALSAYRPLDERAAARSMLPSLLVQGTQSDPTRPALSRRMESLYGAAVIPSTGKIGEGHLLRFTVDSISPAHVPGDPDLLGDGLHLLADILARPVLQDGAFPEETFRREQTQAVHDVRAMFNDKMAWAGQQAITHGCAGEPFAIPEHGGEAAIAELDAAAPEAARRDFLTHGAMWAVAYGALPEEGLLDKIGGFLAELPDRTPEPVPAPVQPARRERRATVERVDVQQSKMVLLFRPSWVEDSKVWAARVLFANMLGGGPHARLFRVVREEMSLCYYAQAFIERYKGMMQVHVGLDEAMAEKVEAEVLRQIDELTAGRFDANELDVAKAGILSTLAAVDDSIAERMEFTSRQWVLGQDRGPAEQAALFASVQPEDVVAAAQDMWLDHAYLLAPEANGS